MLIFTEGAHALGLTIFVQGFAKMSNFTEGAQLLGMSIFGILEHLRVQVPNQALPHSNVTLVDQ